METKSTFDKRERIHEKIVSVEPGINSFSLTTCASERFPRGLRITVEDYEQISPAGREFYGMTAKKLDIREGDFIKLKFDAARQGDVLLDAGLYREQSHLATATVRYVLDQAGEATAVNVPQGSDHEVRTTFGGKASITAEDIVEAERKAEQKIRQAKVEAAAREAGDRQDNGRPSGVDL